MTLRSFLAALPLTILSACPTSSAPECTKQSDCGPTDTSACSSCPASATRYCEGQKCKEPRSGSKTVLVDLSIPTTIASQVASVRYAVYTIRSVQEIPQCKGQSGCSADAVTCDTITAEGFGGTNLNVVRSAATNTNTMNGTVTFFPDISVGPMPDDIHLIQLEARSGTLGEGNTVGKACRIIPAAETELAVTVTAG